MTQRNHPYFNAESGFSLVELSVVLLIMSIILGSVLSVATTKTLDVKIKETNDSFTKLEEAIAAYVAENKRIPCPANSRISQNNANFGKEVVDCSANPGAIPTKTLQIADDYAFDAWGRRITYHVVPTCSNATSFANNGLCPPGSGLVINSASGQPITSNAVFVLLSHGFNGFGAWKHNGGSRIPTATAGAGELQNAGGTGIYVQRLATTAFDDILRYKTKPLVIRAAGGLIGMGGNATPPTNISPLCATVANKITNNATAILLCKDNITCTNALWSEGNTGLAVQVRALCF